MHPLLKKKLLNHKNFKPYIRSFLLCRTISDAKIYFFFKNVKKNILLLDKSQEVIFCAVVFSLITVGEKIIATI